MKYFTESKIRRWFLSKDINFFYFSKRTFFFCLGRPHKTFSLIFIEIKLSMAIYNLLPYELFVQEQMTTSFTNISYIRKLILIHQTLLASKSSLSYFFDWILEKKFCQTKLYGSVWFLKSMKVSNSIQPIVLN